MIKMKKIFIIILMICSSLIGFSQNQLDGINSQMLEKIQQAYKNTNQDKALRNAIAANKIENLVVNLDNEAKFDTYFSNRVKSKGISDQKSSGRCWMFSGFNVLRSDMIAKYDLGEFNFSHKSHVLKIYTKVKY